MKYSSVESLLIAEKVSRRVINKVRALMERDKAIARAFRNGASIKRLSNQHSLPQPDIEDILRFELVLHTPSAKQEDKKGYL